MPRRFFRKFAFKRHHMSQQWFMTPFRHLLHDHRLWGIRRQCVVPAFATGLFVAFLPFPGHMLISALAALALRINIPVAAVTTWVSNPLTVGPMFYFAYRLGVVILDLPPQPFEMELSPGQCAVGQRGRAARLHRAGSSLAALDRQLQSPQTKPPAQRRIRLIRAIRRLRARVSGPCVARSNDRA
jgi:hypothetical protein